MKQIYFETKENNNNVVPYPARIGLVLVPLGTKDVFRDLYITDTIEFVNDVGWCIINKLQSTILDDERFINLVDNSIIEEVNKLFN